jgi:hypothetical protein
MKKLLAPNICLAIYNEANNLEKIFFHIKKSLDKINFQGKPKIYTCLNGCTDNSEEIMIKLKKNSPYPIKILHSKKGKILAHQEIIKNIKNNNPVIFMDADILINNLAIEDLLNALKENNKLRIVSAYPYILIPKLRNHYHKFLLKIINIKRIYPQIEIAKYNVSKFHPDARSAFEKQSRIYFHGRFFALQNKYVYEFPRFPTNIAGDDSFLSHLLINKYPPGSIKVLFETKVYSYPELSLINYFKTWFRILKDIDNIYQEYPEFLPNRKYFLMKINWKFIFNQIPPKDKIFAYLFFLIKIVESLTYRLLRHKIVVNKLWRYQKKNFY